MFNFLAVPFGYLMNWLYIFVDDILHLPIPYVFALFLFLLVTKLMTFPLSINQQKSSARMAAIQPLMQDIQKKFAKDKQRQQQEMQKLQEETGYNPLSGCLPMGINLVLIFGFVEVIYNPLRYMLKLPGALIDSLSTIAMRFVSSGVSPRLIETTIIEQVNTNGQAFAVFERVEEYAADFARLKGFDMTIGGVINLWEQPSITRPSLLWIMPIFSILMALFSSLVAMKANGPAQPGTPGTGKSMIFISIALSAVFAFMYPVGISLYWGLNSLLTIGQTALLRAIINPEKIKKQTLDAYNAKSKGVKAPQVVTITDKKTGKTVEKHLAGAELVKYRLQRARALDAERYGDEVYEPLQLGEYTGRAPASGEPKAADGTDGAEKEKKGLALPGKGKRGKRADSRKEEGSDDSRLGG
jgi:YidC/Oxa1 family membrane protein insertase